MNVEVDLDETQAAFESVGKKRKEDDVNLEMLDDASKKRHEGGHERDGQ